MFTPKSLLRARQARSPIEAFTSGSFAEVLDDPAAGDEGFDPDAVDRVVLCTGKVAYDALARRDELGEAGRAVAVVRVEQLYPWPKATIADDPRPATPTPRGGVAAGGAREHGGLELRARRLHKLLRDTHTLRHVSRAESASPATGSAALHRLEQDDLLARSVG